MKFIRVGLLLLFAFSVLAFGAVEVWSEAILEIGAGLLFMGWAALVFLDEHGEIHWSPLNWPLAGIVWNRSRAARFPRHALSFFNSRRIVETRRIFVDFLSFDPSFS